MTNFEKKTAITDERYQKQGYANRKAYLKELAQEHGMKYEDVVALAQTLGPEEDFDSLVSTIEDFKFMM